MPVIDISTLACRLTASLPFSRFLFLRKLLKILFVVTCTVISSGYFDIRTFFL